MAHTKEYWQTHRKTLLAKRRERYASDPEYRERMRQNAREYRARKRAEREQATPMVTVNGVPTPALTSAEVSEAIGLTEHQLKYYHKQGYLPAALVTRPRRLYTKTQVDLIRDLSQFLEVNSTELRKPKTPEGQSATEKLNSIVQAITSNWET